MWVIPGSGLSIWQWQSLKFRSTNWQQSYLLLRIATGSDLRICFSKKLDLLVVWLPSSLSMESSLAFKAWFSVTDIFRAASNNAFTFFQTYKQLKDLSTYTQLTIDQWFSTTALRATCGSQAPLCGPQQSFNKISNILYKRLRSAVKQSVDYLVLKFL